MGKPQFQVSNANKQTNKRTNETNSPQESSKSLYFLGVGWGWRWRKGAEWGWRWGVWVGVSAEKKNSTTSSSNCSCSNNSNNIKITQHNDRGTHFFSLTDKENGHADTRTIYVQRTSRLTDKLSLFNHCVHVVSYLLSWCFKPSQPQRILSVLRKTFTKDTQFNGQKRQK